MELLSPSTIKALKQVRLWFDRLQPRERWMLIGLGIVILIFMLQALLIAYADHKAGLQNRMYTAETNLLWLDQQQQNITQIRAQGIVELRPQELTDLLQTTAEAMNIQVQVPEATETPFIDISWAGTQPSTFMQYLSTIASKGADIQQLSMQRNGENVQITARIAG